MKTKDNGISLIALVVTIIVLIIIAGVSVANIRNNSGIINQSTLAQKQKMVSEETEALQWSAAQAVAEKSNSSGQISNKGQIVEKLDQYIGNKNEKMPYQIYGPEENYNGTMIISETYVVEFLKTGSVYVVDGNGNVRKVEDTTSIANKDGVLIRPSAISINIDSELELSISANNENYTVSCSDEDVLQVKKDKNGKIEVVDNKITVKGLKLGKATIVVETANEKRAISYITVHQEPVSLELDASSQILDISSPIKSLQIKPTIYPSTANYKTGIEWTSSNDNVAVVDENGFVTGVANGDVTITATTENGVSATWNITVISTPISVGLDKENVILDITLNKTYQFQATIYPTTANASTKLSWTSSNEAVAKVDSNGLVTGISNGTAVITVKTENEKTATAMVIVETSPERISLNKNNATIDLATGNNLLQLNATIYPETTNVNKKITWVSTNTNVLKVDTNGLVRAVGNGNATIIAKTEKEVSDKCEITVKTSILSFEISPTNGLVLQGEPVTIKAELNPKTATEDLVWKCSDNNIATISVSGNNKSECKVSCKGVGSVKITAQNQSGTIIRTAEFVVGIKVSNTNAKYTLSGGSYSDYCSSYVQVPHESCHEETDTGCMIASCGLGGFLGCIGGGASWCKKTVCSIDYYTKECNRYQHDWNDGTRTISFDLNLDIPTNKLELIWSGSSAVRIGNFNKSSNRYTFTLYNNSENSASGTVILKYVDGNSRINLCTWNIGS